ncbi:MAG: HAD family hydrolase, partial [Phycisphaerae bacterium]|nr:HAD family hydrolase [Phycisphaerae bacterium]
HWRFPMPGNNRAVFLDRDGTIVEDPGYLTSPGQLKLIFGAAEAIARLRRAGFLVILATNQSAIARGMMTEQDLAGIHEALLKMLAEVDPNAKFDGVYYCPFHPEAKVAAYRQESYLRKPRPGMLFKAAREHQLDLGSCWMVGDSERDVQAGKTAGCRAIRVHHDPETDTSADRVAPSLAAAADTILTSPGRTPLKTARPDEPAVVEPTPPAEPSPAPSEPAPAEVAAAVEPEPQPQVEPIVEPPPAEMQPIVEPEPPQPEPISQPALGEAESPQASPAATPDPSTSLGAEGGCPTTTQTAPEPEPTAEAATPETTSEPPAVVETPPAPPASPAAAAPDDKLDLAHNARPHGSTKERLLRKIEEEKRQALLHPETPPDALTADKPIRAMNVGDVRHVLAEILQQLRQLNRGPNKHDISATKILGGLFLITAVGLFAWSMVAMFEAEYWRAFIVGVGAVFMQVLSLTFFTMFRQE